MGKFIYYEQPYGAACGIPIVCSVTSCVPFCFVFAGDGTDDNLTPLSERPGGRRSLACSRTTCPWFSNVGGVARDSADNGESVNRLVVGPLSSTHGVSQLMGYVVELVRARQNLGVNSTSSCHSKSLDLGICI